MKYHSLSLILITATGITFAGERSDADKSSGSNDTAERSTTAATAVAKPIPPVLQNSEPGDSMVVRLGAPAKPKTPAAQPSPVQPVSAKLEEPAVKVDPVIASALEDPGRPYLRRAPKASFPPNFERDSAIYCQRLIGEWTLEDASMLLGEPFGSRSALDDQKKQNGTIWSFSDPTGRYRQIELDFDSNSGTLRTVFGYPWSLTWLECRKLWGANVNAAEANKGRKFYSYLNRRMDVLVDPSGKVISLGLY